MIDWYELAIEPTVRRLAAVVRENFDVWIGFCDLDGNMVPLGGAGGKPKAVCERFIANAVDDLDDEVMTCRGSLSRWAQKDRAAGRDDPVKSCHAGLGALTQPILQEGEVVGNVYASGFLASERADALMEKLRRTIETRELISQDHLDHALGTVPLLDRSQRACILALIGAIVQHVEERLDTVPGKFEALGDRYGDMIGTSQEMKRLFNTLRKISRGDSTVLIQGENGTGKELVAQAIHDHSRRATAPFVVQNCAAIPADLIESELFGHKRGAFSGAHRDRLGLFETANHGTFFLDEIGEMDVSLQVKLLRVLQQGTFLPVGDNVFRKVDVRIICATNRDLQELVRQGKFREDLYYRINVIAVEPPPLRHRRDDIPLLASFFLNRACHRHERPRKSLTTDAFERLLHYEWPGNVRELENEMERAVIMSGEERFIDVGRLSLTSRREIPRGLDVATSQMELPEAVEELERRMILEGLRRTGWNKTQTAKELGVSRRNLIRKVAAYDLEKYRES